MHRFYSSRLTLRASHDLASPRGNINTRDRLIMTGQFILQLEATARLCVQVNIVLTSYSERLAVGGEGMVRNGVVEEVVDFGAGHGGEDGRRAVGDSLLLPVGVLGCKLVELWETW